MKRVWLDCDPGHDDVFAIWMAYHSQLQVVGISTVSGNQSLEKTTTNAIRALYAAGVPPAAQVSYGAFQPLLRKIRHDTGIHGDSGADVDPSSGASWPTVPQRDAYINRQLAVLAIADELRGHKTTIIATGPLTNIALLLSLYQEAANWIDEIIFMGGAIGVGNRSPVAEFNILCDPEAAQIVLQSGIKCVMMPLEVTHTAIATEAIFNRLEESRPFQNLARGLLSFFASTYQDVFGFNNGPPVHDPTCVAYVLDPTLFETNLMRVDVETSSELTRGCTVCDVWGYSELPKNCHVAIKMDVSKFWDLLIEAVHKADKVSPC